MISEDKTRIAITISKESYERLKRLIVFVNGTFPGEDSLTKSEVIEWCINSIGDNLGVK